MLDGLTAVDFDSWLAPGLVALAVVGVSALLWTLISAALAKIFRFSVMLTTILEHIRAPAYLVLPLIGLQFVWAAVPDDLPFASLLARATSLALIAALTWLVIRAVAGIAAAIVRLHPANVSDNLEARRIQTQTRVLARTVMFIVLVIGIGAGLMTFPNVRQVGASLLASAGLAGLVAGLAARPVIGSLIAGLQIALTQPIRLDDVVIIDGEWGRIEEITATYVVVKIWDQRRLVVPLQWIIEHPFQNWTRRDTELLGTVFVWLDYRAQLGPLRDELQRVCRDAPEWDGRVALLQVVECTERGMQVRGLVSARDAPSLWDLRCRVREALVDFMQRQEPDGLPRVRAELGDARAWQRRGPAPSARIETGVGDSTSIREAEHAGEHAPEEARRDAETVAAETGPLPRANGLTRSKA